MDLLHNYLKSNSLRLFFASIFFCISIEVSSQIPILAEFTIQRKVLMGETTYQLIPSGKEKLKNSTTIKSDVANYSKSNTNSTSNLINKYQSKFEDFVDKLGLIGEDLGTFMYSDNDIPFEFTLDSVFVFYGIVVNDVYNTLQLKPLERATKAMDKYGKSIINKLTSSFLDSDINKFCIILYYGSKDFSNDLSLKPESLVIYFEKKDYKKLKSFEITDKEFYNKSYILLKDRTPYSDLQRIKF